MRFGFSFILSWYTRRRYISNFVYFVCCSWFLDDDVAPNVCRIVVVVLVLSIAITNNTWNSLL